jgi:hypothetical protein
MNIGMLWFDNDNKLELAAKVKRAAQYYRSKYGKTPTLCYVHPSMLPNGAENRRLEENGATNTSREDEPGLMAAGVEVRSHTSVLPNHFWIGVNGKTNGSATDS